MSSASSASAPRGLAVPGSWRRELGLFLAAYALYGAARWLVAGSRASALEHTGWVVSLERDLGIYIELAIQDALGAGVSGWLLAQVYLTSELLVLPLALVWLYRRRPRHYVTLRSTLLVTWVLAVPVFALLPVAPPRLSGLGFADTVSSGSIPLESRVVTPFYNPYAAMPSLHAGFALALGVAMFAACRRSRRRWLWLGWPALVVLATFATGNHFVLDAVAGGALTVLGWALATSERVRRTLAAARRHLTRGPGDRPAPARPHRALPLRPGTADPAH